MGCVEGRVFKTQPKPSPPYTSRCGLTMRTAPVSCLLLLPHPFMQELMMEVGGTGGGMGSNSDSQTKPGPATAEGGRSRGRGGGAGRGSKPGVRGGKGGKGTSRGRGRKVRGGGKPAKRADGGGRGVSEGPVVVAPGIHKRRQGKGTGTGSDED